MPAWEGKKYKLVKSENFDEYMKKIGEFFLFLCDYYDRYHVLCIKLNFTFLFWLIEINLFLLSC